MSYTKIQRYQRLSPDIQTEWGTFTNPNQLYHPNEMKFRQPAVPNLARGRSNIIHQKQMGQGLGYVGDYVPGPMGDDVGPWTFFGLSKDTLRTVLIMAGLALVIYFLTRPDKTKKNPLNVADMNALLDTGWTPPAGWSGEMPTSSSSSSSSSSPRRKGRQTRAGKKALSRYARNRRRDASGKFI